MTSGRNWCFTLNNPTVDPPALFDPSVMKYYVAQLERGAEGTPHIQGYIQLSTNKRLSGMKKLIPEAHWELRKGTHEQARSYCMKKDTSLGQPFEGGEQPKERQGHRSDLEHFKSAARDGMSMRELLESHSEVVCKYPSFAQKYVKMLKHEAYIASNVNAVPYEEKWQQDLRAALQLPPVPRKIHWVWSKTSETGKTTTLKSLMHEFNVMPCNTWKKMDILHAYTDEKILWFNLPRATEVNATMWQVLEELSDGGVHLAAKYESQLTVVTAHIVVTTNHHPAAAQKALPKRLITYHAQLGDTKDSMSAFEEAHGEWPAPVDGELRFD